MKLSSEISETFKAANIIATILVIAIHYESMSKCIVGCYSDINFISQQFVANGISRVAVPFFALASGFFMVEKAKSNYLTFLKSKCVSLFIPYVFSLTLIFIFILVDQAILYNKINLFNVVLDYVKFMISPRSAYQFWYLRDLMLLVVFSPLLLRMHDFVVLIGWILFVLWFMNLQPFPKFGAYYLLNIETLFFFYLGGICWGKMRSFLEKLVNLKKSIIALLLIIWFVFLLIRVFIDPSVDIWYVSHYSYAGLFAYKLSIVIGLPALIALCSLVSRFKCFLSLFNYTFFVYMFHVIPFRRFTYLVSEDEYSFYFNFPLVTLLSFLSAISLSVICPSFYKIITGSRNSK